MAKGKDNMHWVQLILNLKSSVDNIYHVKWEKLPSFLIK